MKQYKILKTFDGSPDGIETKTYTKDEVVHLTDHLAPIALKEGWAVKVENPVEETKVEAPAETKSDEPTEEPSEEPTEAPAETKKTAKAKKAK